MKGMKAMKKLILALLLVGLVATMTACGGTAETETETEAADTEETAVEEVEETEEEEEPEAVEETASSVSGDVSELKIVKSGYMVDEDGFNYAVEIENPTDLGFGYAGLDFVVKDTNGQAIEDDTLGGITLDYIAPHSTYYYGGSESILVENAGIGSVEFKLDADETSTIDDLSWAVPADQIVVSNEQKGDGVYTCDVTNNSDKDLEDVIVFIIYKQGDEFVGGDYDFVDVPAGQTVPFEIWERPQYEGKTDGFLMHATQYWS